MRFLRDSRLISQFHLITAAVARNKCIENFEANAERDDERYDTLLEIHCFSLIQFVFPGEKERNEL